MFIDFKKAIGINPVTNLTAILNNNIVTLNWKNPKGSFDGVIILRKTGSDFVDDFDGNIVYQGKLETYNDTLPTTSLNYYYKAVSYKNVDVYNADCQSVFISATDETKRYLFFGTINVSYGDERIVDDNNIEEARTNAMYNNYVKVQSYGFNINTSPLNSYKGERLLGRITSANIQLIFNSSLLQTSNMYCYCQNSVGINSFTTNSFSKIKIRGYCQYFTLHKLGLDRWNTYEYHNKIKLFFNVYTYNLSNDSLDLISGINSINNPSLFVGKTGSFIPEKTSDLDEFELSISYDNTKKYYLRAGIEKYEQNYGGLFVITKIWIE